jgi:GLPGLI family protein
MNFLSYILNIALLASISTLSSQENVNLHVKYDFIHQKDKNNTSSQDAFNQTVILSIGKKSSRYCSERLYNEGLNTQMRQNISNPAASAGSVTTVIGGPVLLVSDNGTLMQEEILKDFRKNELNIYAQVGFKSFKVTSEIPKIEWIIKSDKKNLGGIPCQKAEGNYGGRFYTVWFAPSLPFNDGPWKLNGLPGLILEAFDSTNEVRFTFKKLFKSSNVMDESIVSFSSHSSDVSIKPKAYRKLKRAFESDPMGVSMAQFPNTRISIANVSGNANKTASNLRIKKYNALEID